MGQGTMRPSSEPFGFNGDVLEDWEDKIQYVIDLPHQCDNWAVAVEPTPEAAIQRLDQFILEAQNLRAKLISGQWEDSFGVLPRKETT